MSSENNNAVDCYLGNPAPRGATYVFHHDLEDIASGQRCLECGHVFLNKEAKKRAREALQQLTDLGLSPSSRHP